MAEDRVPYVAVVLPNLRPGGAEKLHLVLAREWLREGVRVDFVLLDAQGELLRDRPIEARLIDLGAPRARNAIIPLLLYLRRERPDAVLAAMWPLTVIAPLAARLGGFKGRVVVSEHAPQSLSYAKRGALHNRLMAASMRALYPLASARVGVSTGVADDMAKLSRMRRGEFKVIHNPAATGRVLGDTAAFPLTPRLGGGPMILSVGTLKPVKRHDLLIHAFATLEMPDASLYIIGEGPERARLEALVATLGLQGRVFLPGFQADTAPWYAHADLFVLCSEHEGFGNVIVEALEQGTPVVCTDCPSGPREILADGLYGDLVPVGDVAGLAGAMRASLARGHDRSMLIKRAGDFSVDKAADAYLDVLFSGNAGAGAK